MTDTLNHDNRFLAEQREDHFACFVKTDFLFDLCSSDKPVVVDVAEDDNGDHFAWKPKEGEFEHIYHLRELVEICSPDGFDNAIKTGQGNIVKVGVKVVSQ